jgi:glycine hydroxymethyltransferase
MPGIQGGPLMHVIAGKALAFGEALKQDFNKYCKQIVDNAKTLAGEMKNKGYKLVSNGTDTHLILIDLTEKNISGKLAERKLEDAGITTNKNMVPFDTRSPMITSGIRIGTPALTTRGMKEAEMITISDLIDAVISDPENNNLIAKVKCKVEELCTKFKLYPSL